MKASIINMAGLTTPVEVNVSSSKLRLTFLQLTNVVYDMFRGSYYALTLE